VAVCPLSQKLGFLEIVPLHSLRAADAYTQQVYCEFI
jgi:hypothetical protein